MNGIIGDLQFNSLPWEDPPFLIGKSSMNGPFSIAMVNYRRVLHITNDGNKHVHISMGISGSKNGGTVPYKAIF